MKKHNFNHKFKEFGEINQLVNLNFIFKNKNGVVSLGKKNELVEKYAETIFDIIDVDIFQSLVKHKDLGIETIVAGVDFESSLLHDVESVEVHWNKIEEDDNNHGDYKGRVNYDYNPEYSITATVEVVTESVEIIENELNVDKQSAFNSVCDIIEDMVSNGEKGGEIIDYYDDVEYRTTWSIE